MLLEKLHNYTERLGNFVGLNEAVLLDERKLPASGRSLYSFTSVPENKIHRMDYEERDSAGFTKTC